MIHLVIKALCVCAGDSASAALREADSVLAADPPPWPRAGPTSPHALGVKQMALHTKACAGSGSPPRL